MGMFGKETPWNGWVFGLLGAGAVLGVVNSILQLGRFCPMVAGHLAPRDQTMMALWLGLLVVWLVFFGVLLGITIGRQWYGAESGSMAPSD